MKNWTFAIALAAAVAFSAIAADRASAESPVTFSGYLRLRTFALGGLFPTSNADAIDRVSDRYAVSRLRLNVVFKPSDNIEVRWRLHGPHGSRWGTTSTSPGGDLSLNSVYFYGLVKTEWGNISVGRLPSDVDSAGLKTLGYAPVWGLETLLSIFDRDSENDGILFFNEWDNGFGIRAFYVKRAQRTFTAADYAKDSDYDRISFEPFYKWDGGGATLALQYDRNAFNASYGVGAGSYAAVQKNYTVTINPAFLQSWKFGENTFSIHAEAKFAFGRLQPSPAGGVEQETQKRDGFGAWLDFSLGYPQGDATLAGWFFRGNDEGPGYNRPDDWKDHGLVNGGEGFYPFLLFNRSTNLVGNTVGLGGNHTSGNWGIALLGNHKLHEFVTLNYALGSFRRTNDYILAGGQNASRSLGTELDLGLTIKILDGLQWQTKFAVYDAGGYYSDRYGHEGWDRTIWGWGNEFLFSF
jgi:hypothetical protein